MQCRLIFRGEVLSESAETHHSALLTVHTSIWGGTILATKFYFGSTYNVSSKYDLTSKYLTDLGQTRLISLTRMDYQETTIVEIYLSSY